MKFLSLILAVFLLPAWISTTKPVEFGHQYSPPPFDQVTKDTVINGLNVLMTYYSQRTDSSEAFYFYPGAGEVGTDSTKLRLYGPHYWLCNQGWDGSVVMSNGTHYPLLFSIQPLNQSTKANVLKPLLDILATRFKIKVYARHAGGPSAGGWYAAQIGAFMGTTTDHSYNVLCTTMLLAEAVKPTPYGGIAGTAPDIYPQNMVEYVKAGVHFVMGFNQISDGGRDMLNYFTRMKDTVAGSAVLINTNFSGGGHCCFENFWNPSQNNWTATNTNVSSLAVGSYWPASTNYYQYALAHGDFSVSGGNPAPTVTVAGGGTITLPTNTKNLTSSATNGTSPFTYSWTKVSGPTTYTINTPTAQNSTVSNLVAGTYVFQCVWTDANGLTGSDQGTVIVNNGANQPPIPRAGNDQTITQPTASVTLDGSASTDPDGTISTYAWTQIAGSSANIQSPSNAVTVVNGMNTAGTYTFQLQVVDNLGASALDTVNVTVNANNGNAITVRMYLFAGSSGYAGTGGWNPWNTVSSLTISNLLDITGLATSWSAALSGQAGGIVDNGSSYAAGTANPIVPIGVMRFASYQSSGIRTITLTGLNPSSQYTVTYFGTRNATATNFVKFSIGAKLDSLNTSKQYTQSLSFINQVPASNGSMLLSFDRGTGAAGTYVTSIEITQQGSTANTAPTASVGPNQTIALPLDSVSVTGTATDPDPEDSTAALTGLWQQTGGPQATTVVIENPTSFTTEIIGLDSIGTYTFQFTATDTHGATGNASLTVSVTSSSGAVSIAAPRDTTLPLQQKGRWGNEALYDTTQFKLTATVGPNVTGYRWKQLTGPSTLQFTNKNVQTTNSWGYIPGRYTIEIMGSNVTDSAKDTINIRVVDWQTYAVRPCRPGGVGLVWNLAKTSGTSLFKLHIERDVFLNAGTNPLDRIMGGDTLTIPGGTYTGGINISGFGGSEGCPVVVVPKDSAVIVRGAAGVNTFFRVGNGDDSAIVAFAKIDGSVLMSKGIYYGFQHDPPSYTAAVVGITINTGTNIRVVNFYAHRAGVGMFVKMNADSLHAIQNFNSFRQYGMHFDNVFLDSSGTELVYNGNTSPDGINGGGSSGHGPSIRGDSIYFNGGVFRNGGYDGIQIVDFVWEDVNDVWIYNTGLSHTASQRSQTIIGANVGNIHDAVLWNGQEGLIGTPWGACNFYNLLIGNVQIANATGSGIPSSLALFGGLTGPGSSIFETRTRFSAHVYNNVVVNAAAYALKIYNQDNWNSTTVPTEIDHNIILDSASRGRTLTDVIYNYPTGIQLTHDNFLYDLFTYNVSVTDLSTKTNGPLFSVSVGSQTKTFTSAKAASQFVYQTIIPPGVFDCRCLKVTYMHP